MADTNLQKKMVGWFLRRISLLAMTQSRGLVNNIIFSHRFDMCQRMMEYMLPCWHVFHVPFRQRINNSKQTLWSDLGGGETIVADGDWWGWFLYFIWPNKNKEWRLISLAFSYFKTTYVSIFYNNTMDLMFTLIYNEMYYKLLTSPKLEVTCWRARYVSC